MANTTLTQTGQQVQADLDLLDNNNATQGQVLTADGQGGCAWANAGGGSGTQLYKHQIQVSDNNNNNFVVLKFTGYGTINTPITTYSLLSSNITNLFIIGNLRKYVSITEEVQYSIMGFFQLRMTLLEVLGHEAYKTGIIIGNSNCMQYNQSVFDSKGGYNFGDFDETHYTVTDTVTPL